MYRDCLNLMRRIAIQRRIPKNHRIFVSRFSATLSEARNLAAEKEAEIEARSLQTAANVSRGNMFGTLAAAFVGSFCGGAYFIKYHVEEERKAALLTAPMDKRLKGISEGGGEESNTTSSSSPVLNDWNYDWDGRLHLYKKKRKLGTKRILLVRHGEYSTTGSGDENKRLTDLGKFQAKETAKRLVDEGVHFDRVLSSTMCRAKETAEIIGKGLEYTGDIEYDDLLREGAPSLIIPRSDKLEKSGFFDRLEEDGPNMLEGFKKHINRCENADDETILVVCHGNVIRSFTCRVLQFPVEAWLRLCTDHCGLTEFVIRPDGKVSLKRFGDAGHMVKKTA